MAFLLILAALVITKTPSGTEAQNTVRGGVTNARVACSVQPLRPAKRGGQVAAVAEFRCDRPGPERLGFVVHLQRSPDGKQWATVATQAYTTSGLDATSAKPASGRRLGTTAPCAAATWRTAVEWTLVDKGRTTKGERTSDPRKNPC